MMTLFDEIEEEKKEIDHTVLNKILSVSTNPIDKIKDADLAYCQRINKMYEDAKAQLLKWKAFFDEELKENWKEEEYEKHYRSEEYTLKASPHRGTETLKDQYFFCGYSLNHINNALDTIHKRHINYIVGYFKKGYNLKLEYEHYHHCKNYEEVIAEIYEHISGDDLTEAGIDTFIKELRRAIKPATVQLRKDKIKVNREWTVLHETIYGKWEFRPDKELITLYKSFCFHNDRSLNELPMRNIQDYEEVDFSKQYAFFSCRVKYMKFYKKGSYEICFNSEDDAKSYFDLFELHKTEI